MSWGDPNSASARAVIQRAREGLDAPGRRRALRRARKGLDTPARRRALKRAARDPHTFIDFAAGDDS